MKASCGGPIASPSAARPPVVPESPEARLILPVTLRIDPAR
jgi:hypothetical protein